MRKLIILAGAALGLLLASCAKEEKRTISVIPAPLNVELQQGVFPLNPETGLYIDASEGDKKILQDYLAASPMKLKPVATEEGHTVILKQVAQLPEVDSPEGYVLTVTPDQVLVRATSGAGLFYGVQTMLQLADEKGLPAGVTSPVLPIVVS
jgi:hexosaminidase